jgi:hypothetical protein
VLLHEFYYRSRTSEGRTVGYIRPHERTHGSVGGWQKDFSVRSRPGWAVLAYDPYDDRWHNAVMDSDNDGVWVGADPLVVCDVAMRSRRTISAARTTSRSFSTTSTGTRSRRYRCRSQVAARLGTTLTD